jgi:hypothetical protein
MLSKENLMRPYQRSLLGQQEAFMPIKVDPTHLMAVMNQNLDWDFMQCLGERRRELVVTSNRGLKPHYRALNGAVVVRTLEGSNFRKTEDLIRYYTPARELCDLQNSEWTPDHVAIWEYEGMLGEEGLAELTDYVLRSAAKQGFADPRGLCADTTAQEAYIPYPTEVGHMNSFMKSLRANLSTLLKKSKGLAGAVAGKMGKLASEIAEKVRKQRLFDKTKEARQKTNRVLLDFSQDLLGNLGDFLADIDVKKNQVRGTGKRALNNLSQNFHHMCQMFSQISQWVKKGSVAKNKIISLFNVDFRAINRGKVGKNVEFGLKWGINQIRGGYVSVYMHQNMMCHDANYAVLGVKEHIRIFGKPPRDFGFDRAAWSAEHKKEIRKLGVKNLAIAPKGKARWDVGPRVKDRMVCERSQIEGKIGTMKRTGLNKSEAKLPNRVRMSALKAGLCLNLKRFAKDLSMVQTAMKASAAI